MNVANSEIPYPKLNHAPLTLSTWQKKVRALSAGPISIDALALKAASKSRLCVRGWLDRVFGFLHAASKSDIAFGPIRVTS